MVDLVRDGARWFRAQLPILLPGFGAFIILLSVFGENLGSGALALFFGVVAAALLGLLVQALRVVTFDFVRRLLPRAEGAEPAPPTWHYALLANLATLWAVLILALLAVKSRWVGKNPATLGAFLLMLLVGVGLVVTALQALRAPPEPPAPPPPARRTSRKKKTP